MLGSPDHELLGLEEDSCLLPSSESRSHDRTRKGPRYRDRIADQDVELSSISSAPIDLENQNLQAHEEDFFIGPSTPLYSNHTGPKRSAASIYHALFRWVKGPRPSRPFKIEPILPQFQYSPIAFLDKYCAGRKQRSWLLLILCILWMILFSALLSTSISGCRISGYHTPIRLSCVSRLWSACLRTQFVMHANSLRRGSAECGLDGSNCRPFHNVTFPFRCPSDCRDTKIYSPETIGDIEYNYRSIVIGGLKAIKNEALPIYRGDSFICGAAIHAGISSNYGGGSGVVSLIGEYHNFQSVDANGISSLNFTPSFPLSFTFLKNLRGDAAHCNDPRWVLLFITLLFTVTISIFTTSPSVFFGVTLVSTYFCVALASDPPDFENYSDVISVAFRGFFPAVFVGLVVYRFCIRYTLNGLNAQIEKTILWLGGCWIGALNNFTFDRLPLQRLTPHDLGQPGAILTLVVIVLAILFIAIFQAWAFRVEGRMPQYLAFYACLGLLLLALMAIPNMNVRIHHFILALIFLPGTTLQTRPSLLYQGLLVGLFISGIARWGFDSILQTSVDLFGDDFGSPIPQIDVFNVSSNDDSITFSWKNISHGYDSMSVVVNDVERFRGSEDHNDDYFKWTRYKPDEPEYFRFAYVKYGIARGPFVGKFSNPGIWNVDGTWIPPKPS